MTTKIIVIVVSVLMIGLIIGAVLVLHNGSTNKVTASPSPSSQASGLKITDKVVGTGTAATADSTVTVKYTGTLADGTVFDSTDKHGGDPITFPLSGVIKGWQDGIPGMKVGGTRVLVIPGDLAYGANPPSGSGIPVNATLTFEIQLVAVK